MRIKKIFENIIYITLALISIFLICYFGYRYINTSTEYNQSVEIYEDSIKLYVKDITIQESSINETKQDVNIYLPDIPEIISTEDDEIIEQVPIEIDFKALKRINSDICGWIYIPQLEISYPVAQTTNNSYYISYTYNHQKNSSGCIFIDYRNKNDLSDYNTIIYGHSMNNTTMFHNFRNYFDDHETFKNYKYFYYLTPEHNYRMDILACVITRPTSESYNIIYSLKDLHDYLERVKVLNEVDNDFDIRSVDRIVTFSTCANYVFGGAREIIICKPVEILNQKIVDE